MRSSTRLAGVLVGCLAGALAGPALAQTTPGGGTQTTTTPTTTTPTTTTAGTLTPNSTNGAPAGNGNPGNPAVASNGSDATAPAKGANSFTEDQAQSRIATSGFSDVAALKKDADGIWRGTAMKNAQQVQVWLDYKGNVGQQ